jgi:hypothetical protein
LTDLPEVDIDIRPHDKARLMLGGREFAGSVDDCVTLALRALTVLERKANHGEDKENR